jgi:hypothetical protein
MDKRGWRKTDETFSVAEAYSKARGDELVVPERKEPCGFTAHSKG